MNINSLFNEKSIFKSGFVGWGAYLTLLQIPSTSGCTEDGWLLVSAFAFILLWQPMSLKHSTLVKATAHSWENMSEKNTNNILDYEKGLGLQPSPQQWGLGDSGGLGPFPLAVVETGGQGAASPAPRLCLRIPAESTASSSYTPSCELSDSLSTLICLHRNT